MDSKKFIIKEKLLTQNLDGIEELILEYQQERPEDFELISIKVLYFLSVNDFEEALIWAQYGVRKNPYNTEANYNLAYVSEIVNNYYEAYIFYYKVLVLSTNEQNKDITQGEVQQKMADVLDKFIEQVESEEDEGLKKANLDKVMAINEDKTAFGLLDDTFKEYEKNIGTYYHDYSGNKVFTGFYDRHANYFGKPDNMVQAKGEMRAIVGYGNEFKVNGIVDHIIPILSEKENILLFAETDKEYHLPINNPNHFSYYRVRPNTKIFAKEQIHVGKPIPIQFDLSKKKFVLSLFIDGLTQTIFNDEGFENIMPNTHQFFKKGVMCKRAYSTAEWTYPSLASYVTGYSTPNHMLISSKLNVSLPTDVTLLSEYFSKEGYQTGKIDGNWRSTPNYGYLRGIDRAVFQHQWAGMRSGEVIGDALEHMELLKDTNHHLWLEIGDLHDIADEISLQPSVESKLYAEERIVEKGITSAKQPYSIHKRIAYIHQARMVDEYLNIIYSYIEKNYRDDEIIISLFSDHGQGYLVKSNEFFLAPERTNVAFMFRGGNITPSVSEELISTADYSAIMCKLCDIPMEEKEIDGRLPKIFGGTDERKYVITESIHPRDPYYASIYWEDYVCNFTSVDNVGEDGRFHLHTGDSIQLKDYDGQELIDEEKKKENYEIILQHIAGLLIYD